MVRILSRRAGLSLVKSTPLGVLGVGNYRAIKREAADAEGAHRVPEKLKCRKRKMQRICMQSTWNHADILRPCKGELLYLVQALDLASYFALK
jgi:hypothetical protein